MADIYNVKCDLFDHIDIVTVYILSMDSVFLTVWTCCVASSYHSQSIVEAIYHSFFSIFLVFRLHLILFGDYLFLVLME